MLINAFSRVSQDENWDAPNATYLANMPHFYTPQGQHRLAVFIYAFGDIYGNSNERAGDLGGFELLGACGDLNFCDVFEKNDDCCGGHISWITTAPVYAISEYTAISGYLNPDKSQILRHRES